MWEIEQKTKKTVLNKKINLRARKHTFFIFVRGEFKIGDDRVN